MKILAVDDDSETLKVLQFILKSGGFVVDTVTNGEEALQECQTSKEFLREYKRKK